MLGPIGLLLALILALCVGYFAVLNPTPVTVQLLPGLSPRSAFVWEIAAYSAMSGALVSALFLLWAWLGAQSRLRQLRRRVRELEGRLQQAQPVVGEASLPALENGVSAASIPPMSADTVPLGDVANERGAAGRLTGRRRRADPGRAAAASGDEEPV